MDEGTQGTLWKMSKRGSGGEFTIQGVGGNVNLVHFF